MRALILYGPPAAGKDTVTRALCELDGSYKLYERLKVGSGRASGYRMSTMEHVDKLRASGKVLWENRRYDSLYVIDRDSLADDARAHTPVIHVGQIGAVSSLVNALPVQWLVTYLWCPRDVAERRIVARNTGDVEARLQAWDETSPLTDADLVINTADVEPFDTAKLIDGLWDR